MEQELIAEAKASLLTALAHVWIVLGIIFVVLLVMSILVYAIPHNKSGFKTMLVATVIAIFLAFFITSALPLYELATESYEIQTIVSCDSDLRSTHDGRITFHDAEDETYKLFNLFHSDEELPTDQAHLNASIIYTKYSKLALVYYNYDVEGEN